MTITSYAQNFEDVILWRALKHVKSGTYIDLGAQDPVIDSVSLAFYEQGWRGVHVEPNPFYADRIRKARPDEEVIEVAIGVHEETIAFFDIADTGLSTGDTSIAEMHRARGHTVKRIDVACMPLSKILKVHEGHDVHWLKIDVEGMEKQVIESWSGSPVRPWVVLVESTKPNSPEPNYSEWEPQLLALGYEFVYFDGLNRFYVSAEHPELKPSFHAGPNVFDQFVLSGTSSASFSHKLNAEISELRRQVFERTAEITHLSRELELLRNTFMQATAVWKTTSGTLSNEIRLKNENIDRLRQTLAARDNEVARLNNEAAHHNQQVTAIYRSTSWRISAPLRFASRGGRWFLRGMMAWAMIKPGSRPHRIAAAISKLLRSNRESASRGAAEIKSQVNDALSASGERVVQSGGSEKIQKTTVIAHVDMIDEPRSVSRNYKQLVYARKHHLVRE